MNSPEGTPSADQQATQFHWYAIRVQSNKEDSVKRNLERKVQLRGFQDRVKEILVPTEKVTEIRNGKKRLRTVKTYPGYVLINLKMDDDVWLFVREVIGVGDFVGAGALTTRPGAGQKIPKPFPLRPEEVAKILGSPVAEGEGAKIKIAFAVGDKVKIKEGPFENFDGVVEDINEQKGLVRVVVTIFGRATPVELQYWQVEPL